MREDPAAAELDSATRSFVTLAFIDLCGSTRLANSLDPDNFAALLGEVRATAATIVRDHGGLVSQVYGDGLLALFRGASAADQALAATLAVHRKVRAMPPVGSERLQMHSGVHSGLVLLCPGDAERGRLEMIGRATGIAARLSAAAGPDEVLVSRSTLGPLAGRYALGPERLIAVSGAGDQVSAVPLLGGDAATAPLSGAAGRRTPFWGRSTVIAAIAVQLLQANGAATVSVAVTGPPGQGKSRLSEEFELRAAEAQAMVLRGAAVQGEQGSILQPFREIDAAAARILGDAPDPASGDLSGLPSAILARLRRLAERGRVLLILDDWQWADSASLQLLARLRVGGPTLGILLLSREATPGGLPIVADQVIDLQPLDDDASTALVERLRPELDMLDRQRVCRLAGGNPLYLEELCLLSVRALEGLLSADPGNDEIGRIAAIIEARVRALPEDLAPVLHAAAVIGGECGEWVLETLCGVAPGSPPLIQLRELDLLIPSLTPGNVRFKHGVIRNVVYQLLHLEERRLLHRKVAELIERRNPAPADRDELLAWHLYESGDYAGALRHAEAAGDRAVAAASIDRAQLQYGRALKAIEQLPDDDFYADRVRLVGKFGFACVYDSDCEQLAVFDRAAAVARARGDAGGEAIARYWYGFVCHAIGQARRAVAEISRAIALSNQPAASPFGAQLRATLGQALAAAGRHREAAPLLDFAIGAKRAHRSGRNVSVGMAYALALKGAVLGDTGHFPEARALIDEALGLAAGHNHPVEGSVIGWSAAIRFWQGDWQGLLEVGERGCEVALRIETVYIHAISRAFAAYARWRLTGDEAAAEDLAHAVDCMADRGKELALSIAYGCLADTEASRGRADETRAALRHAYRCARAGEPFGLPVAARAWARLVAPSDPERARRMLLHARANARRRGAPHELARCDLEEAALGLVPPAVAAARLEAAAAELDRMGISEDAQRARALMRAGESPPHRARTA